jgi:hypothetical protein
MYQPRWIGLRSAAIDKKNLAKHAKLAKEDED